MSFNTRIKCDVCKQYIFNLWDPFTHISIILYDYSALLEIGLIPPSHLLGISRNQAEPAGMKNFQNLRHIREGISNPSHIRGGMSRNDGGMEILYTFLDMRFGGVLNYVRTHSRANRDVPTEFERQSKDSDDIWIAFQLNSFNIEIDSGSKIKMHSRCIPAHSRRIWDILAIFEVACRFDSLSKAIRMFWMLFECRNGL